LNPITPIKSAGRQIIQSGSDVVNYIQNTTVQNVNFIINGFTVQDESEID